MELSQFPDNANEIIRIISILTLGWCAARSGFRLKWRTAAEGISRTMRPVVNKTRLKLRLFFAKSVQILEKNVKTLAIGVRRLSVHMVEVLRGLNDPCGVIELGIAVIKWGEIALFASDQVPQ